MNGNEVDGAWDVLVPLSVATNDDSHREAALKAIAASVDIAKIEAQAARNSMSAALGWLASAEPGCPIGTAPRIAFTRNLDKWRAYVDEASRITRALVMQGTPVAVTKGVVGQVRYYASSGAREFSDLDLMVANEHGDAVRELLREFAYTEGAHFKNGELVPFTKHELAMYRMFPDHLPDFVRVHPGDHPDHFIVDTALSMTWHTSKWQVPESSYLSNLVTVEASGRESILSLPALSRAHDFCFIALHCFRENWVLRPNGTSHPRLHQYADLYSAWRSMSESEKAQLIAAVGDFGIGGPVAWVANLSDQLYGSEILSGLGLDSMATTDWCESVFSPTHGMGRWSGEVRDLLCRAGEIKVSFSTE